VKKNIMVSAVEVSADMHAANLVKALQQLDPEISFYGVGGEQLRAAGVDILEDITNFSSIGF